MVALQKTPKHLADWRKERIFARTMVSRPAREQQVGGKREIGTLVLLTVATWSISFLLLQWLVPYQLFAREQQMLFLMDGEWLNRSLLNASSHLPKLGWAVRLAGDFFTQFYYYIGGGATVLSTVLALLSLTAYRLFRSWIGRRWALLPTALIFGWELLREMSVGYELASTLWLWGLLVVGRIVTACVHRRGRPARVWLATLSIALLLWGMGLPTGKLWGWPNEQMEWLTAMDVEASRGQWDKVRRLAAQDRHSTIGSYYYNLSNAVHGELADRLLVYYQPFEQGLFLPVDEHQSQMGFQASGEVWYRLGEWTMAEHSTILAMIFSPHQTGSRFLRRLAEINRANGDEEAAAKYLAMLSKSLVHHRWAMAMTKNAVSGPTPVERLASDAGKGSMTADRPWTIVHTADDVRTALRRLLVDHPDRLMARDYLLAYDLLIKDLEAFMMDYEAHPVEARIYQEALLVWLTQQGQMDADHLAHYALPMNVLASFDEYNKAYTMATAEGLTPQEQQRKLTELQLQFGHTYWFWLHFATRQGDMPSFSPGWRADTADDAMSPAIALDACSTTTPSTSDTVPLNPEENLAEAPLTSPDYADATIPCNIAPLNFRFTNAAYDRAVVEVRGPSSTLRVKARHGQVIFPVHAWKSLLQSAKGQDLQVTVKEHEAASFTLHVASDPIDEWLTYRLIEPGYEVWHKVEIRERNLTNWRERVIADHRHTNNACMNCHIHGRDGQSLFYLRGTGGGAFLSDGSSVRKLSLRDDEMISSTVYGDLHPSGRYGVFSTNIIIPGFHTVGGRRLEVYDTASDLVVADFAAKCIIHSPLVDRADVLETFPTFAADGRSVIYCAADTVRLPAEVGSLRYSLCRIGFDAEHGAWGTTVDTLWNADVEGGSACLPKASPDGRWLLYTVADYGTFPIWHQECDLQLMDLATGDVNSLSTVNAYRSDTYHSWSSNSRWFVFASKRGDGQYGRPYICHLDANGVPGKPFVLPQRHPNYYDNTLKSFNIPDLGTTPVPFNARRIGRMQRCVTAETFE